MCDLNRCWTAGAQSRMQWDQNLKAEKRAPTRMSPRRTKCVVKDGHLLSREFGCAVLLDAVWLTTRWAEIIRPLKRVHDQVGKALCVPSQITVGDIVQVEEIIHKVAHDAEAARCAVIIAVRCEFASLQAAHGGHLVLGKVRRIGKYPVEGVRCDSIAVIVEREREGTVETRSGRTKKLGSRTVGVGDRERMKLRGESGGVDEGDKVGELLSEDMLS